MNFINRTEYSEFPTLAPPGDSTSKIEHCICFARTMHSTNTDLHKDTNKKMGREMIFGESDPNLTSNLHVWNKNDVYLARAKKILGAQR